ncbi:3'-5' exonuclease [Chryseolinea sp. T2]|uniref:HelD family protein n=1 Tax=Chryseolinea sp. T2 TaxID=3129255 RepID=UPI003077338B
MLNPTEQSEREYLGEIREKLMLSVQLVDDNVKQFSEELRQKKQYIHEHQSGMDEADIVAAGQSIDRIAFTGESVVERRRKLMKLMDSPYFGRIDFTPQRGKTNAVYIGLHSYASEVGRSNLIYDWRAPVSSLFYDYELGEASYQTPSGQIKGEISVKRQYRIRDGKMEFMIENAVNIQDEILQRELSKSADDKMKNIVATIQRDQNAVIRNDTSKVMIIQGVAGSGKTSIALHRIAFLLYRFRDTITAKDILIISPNKVFASYISNVLPELGEETIPETGMEELASELLDHKYPFQSFFEQVTEILEHNEESFAERIRFKASFEFLSKLNQYLIHVENNYFDFTELRVAGTVVPFPFILERFRAYYRIPILKRFPEVIRDIQQHVRTMSGKKLNGQDRARLWEQVPRMFRFSSVLELYEDFYRWLGKPEMFKLLPGGELEYSDVFPLIYFRIRVEGVASFDHVKHLLVDEMQDYTAVQYAVLNRLFSCKKTILGDVNQKVNPFSASSSDDISRVFPNGDSVKLVRSYRSTIEITNFAQRISRNPELIPMERYGDEPKVLEFGSNIEEANAIREMLYEFNESSFQSLGILCKTFDQASTLYEHLKEDKDFELPFTLLDAESTSFKNGIIITTVHLSKGLEFDNVIVPFASDRNYKTAVDRSMLYIACTRAMHKLTLTYSRSATVFVAS